MSTVEREELRCLHKETKARYPHLYEDPDNMSPAGYYCEAEDRQRAFRQIKLFGEISSES
jgi:hypothetical protein